MPAASIYWHDYETFGTDARRDRPAQFAGQRTNLELDLIGDPLTVYCRPAPDVLPQPTACLITGITPQHAQREGVAEAEFAARIHEELSASGTCGAGFNSIRFDDEFTRNLLYRNFFDPYEREWKDGNSRWDIIDLARLCYALRPQGMQWPLHDGKPSFKLQELASANNLSRAQAHDAASDVTTTIDLARRLKRAQPRLWDFYFALRNKNRARDLLDVAHRTPVLHVSSRYPAEHGCLAVVAPLAPYPDQQNKVIVFDLAADPTPLLELDADEIADRVFTARADLPEGVARIPLKAVSINKSPALAPLSALKDVDTQRIGLDVARCEKHAQRLRDAPGLLQKLQRVFASVRNESEAVDPELAIYRGFASDADRRVLREVRASPPADLRTKSFAFRDARYAELLFRYRARNFPNTLNPDERARWQDFRRTRLTESTPLTTLTLDRYFTEFATLRANPVTTATQQAILDRLEQWGRNVADELSMEIPLT